MKQIIFDFGTLPILDIPLRVFGYGLMLVCGFLVAIFFARWRTKRAGEDPDSITYIGMVGLLGVLLGQDYCMFLSTGTRIQLRVLISWKFLTLPLVD